MSGGGPCQNVTLDNRGERESPKIYWLSPILGGVEIQLKLPELFD